MPQSKHASTRSITRPALIGQLKGYTYWVNEDIPLKSVIDELMKRPELPGVMLVQAGKCMGVISRNQCLEHLSRPYGVELFLNRPIRELVTHLELRSDIYPGSMRIEEAVPAILSRPARSLYEPIIVRDSGYPDRLVDVRALLLAHSRLLIEANALNRRQIEIGRSLSNILDLQEVYHRIFESLADLVPYDWGVVLILEGGTYRVASIAGFPSSWNCQQAETMVSEFALLADLNRICRPEIVTNFYPRGGPRQDPSTPSALSGMYFPFIYGDQVLATLFLARTLDEPGLSAFSQDDLDLLMGFAAIFTPAIRNAQLHAEVKKLAVTDPLTQVNNRRGFLDSTLGELERARQTRQSVSWLMIDIDHFKEINDRFGHATGDQVIQELTRRLKTCLRAEDYIGRYGGDEFVILLSGIDRNAGFSIAERIRERICEPYVTTDRGELPITISIGVAQFDPDLDSADELLEHADRALYEAKRNGRNRTEVWNADCLFVSEVQVS